jgi:5-methylcytosine-specific restriction endonuclease McrA
MCGAKEDPKHVTFQVHHIVFKCNGGSNNINTLMLLCPDCHRMLHNSSQTRNSRKNKSRKKRK